MFRPDPSIDPAAEPTAELIDLPASPDDVTDGDRELGPEAPEEPAQRPTRRRFSIPPRARRPAVLATIALTITALIAGLFAWGSASPILVSTADASPNASPTASAAPSSNPSAIPAETFQPIPGTTIEPIARLTARGANGAVVPVGTAFRLESAGDIPVRTLADRLTVEPHVKLAVTPESNRAAVLLTPDRQLRAGTVYRFSLHGSTGELLDSWAFQAKQPLRIVGTLPGDRESDVPLDTGIEITFDQDGVIDADTHVSIDPAIGGRFEMHERTLAFVADRFLRPTTIYTVTVRRGITTSGTGEATIAGTTFRFETGTGQPNTGEDPLVYQFPDAVAEAPTAERPVIALWSYGGDPAKAPKAMAVDVFRLAGLEQAIAGFRALRARPSWTHWSRQGLVDTTSLGRVVHADIALHALGAGLWFELPERLSAGWYVVETEAGARPSQLILQVTDVAGYLAVSDTKTIVWANDLRTGRPIVGAVAQAGSIRLGTTNADGLIRATTPSALFPAAGTSCSTPCDPVVVVRAPDGRSIFLPATGGDDRLFAGSDSWYWETDPGFWSLFQTDRGRYRPGDTVNVWGMVRDRASGDVPDSISVRLVAYDRDGDGSSPTLLSRSVRARSTGAFSASIALGALPAGDYTLRLMVGRTEIRSLSFVVGAIAKPAYTLSVATARRVYLAEERIEATAEARFFEGTPVAGVPIHFEGGDLDGSATTDQSGHAMFGGLAHVDTDSEDYEVHAVQVTPGRAEEAEITGASDEILVFPSSRVVEAHGSIAAGEVRASGTVHVVAVSRLEREIANGVWDLDPKGAVVGDAAVEVTFIELIPHRSQVGTEYDFIEKKVVPVFETDIEEHVVKTTTVHTSGDGSWTASIPASATDHDYLIKVRAADGLGRVARASTGAPRRAVGPDREYRSASLEETHWDENRAATYGIGDQVDVTMVDPTVPQAAGDGTAYLFFTAQLGIRDATIQGSRRYRLDFPSWGAPNLTIGAVRFTGAGYVGTAWYDARFRTADRRLDVSLSSDASRYAPRDTAVVSVRTRDAAGRSVPATVVLRVVDEKLFTIGAAFGDDPLAELYGEIGNGIATTYLSHQPPVQQGEGGDTTGGGDDRDDFRDALLFETITTDADGRGQVEVPLSDDLTSWRVTASGLTRRLEAGGASMNLPVTLPFFVEASIAPQYLVADRASIPVRVFGTGLTAGTPVSVHVTSTTLGFDSGPIASTAFATVDVPLPVLRAGTQSITIEASTGSGAGRRIDRLTRSFGVVETRLTHIQSAFAELPLGGPPTGGSAGFTTVVVSDAGAGRYDALLDQLAEGGGGRLDRALAADLARALLADRAGPDASPPDSAFVLERYTAPDGGLSVVPYASSDLELSALVAIVAPGRVDRSALAAYFERIRSDPDETRERRAYALAGLAGLGEPVVSAVRAALSSEATVRERLVLGLGAAALGDAETARRALGALVTEAGEQSGHRARLRIGTGTEEITEATALAAVLAAKVGDPMATRFWASVEANPQHDRIEVLTGIAFVEAILDHLAAEPASFAWTLDGERHEVHLARGEAFRTIVTADQLAGLHLEGLTGATAVTTTWREPVGVADLAKDPDMTITRDVTPGLAISNADLVIVDLKVAFGPAAASGCREVTELVPSGLAAIGATGRWPMEDEEAEPADGSIVLPYAQEGSVVSFCVAPTLERRAFTLRYVARVVTPGTYAWEPAIGQVGSGGGVAAVTPPTRITIR